MFWFQYFKTAGQLTVDVSQYKIFVNENFFVTLSWIKSLGNKGMELVGALNGQPSYARVTSEGDWEKLPLFKLSFSATLLCKRK